MHIFSFVNTYDCQCSSPLGDTRAVMAWADDAFTLLCEAACVDDVVVMLGNIKPL